MSNEVKLSLKDNYIEVEIEEGGAVQNKNIEYKSLTSLFQENTESYVSPLLPGEYGVQKIGEDGRYTHLFYLEPPRKIDVTYIHSNKPLFRKDYFSQEEWEITQEEDETDEDFEERLKERFNILIEKRENKLDGMYKQRFTFVSPRLLWFFKLHRNYGGGYNLYEDRVFSMKSSILSGRETLYKAPTSNVFPSSKVCWGRNSVEVPSMKAVQGISTFFFNAPFDSDLEGSRIDTIGYTGLNGRQKEGYLFYNLLEATTAMLSNGEPFEKVLRFVEDSLVSVSSVDNEIERLMPRI